MMIKIKMRTALDFCLQNPQASLDQLGRPQICQSLSSIIIYSIIIIVIMKWSNHCTAKKLYIQTNHCIDTTECDDLSQPQIPNTNYQNINV